METEHLMAALYKLFSFKVDYKKEEELKIASIYFFVVFIFLRLLAVGLDQSPFFSLVLTIGALVYLMATIHFLHHFLERIWKKQSRWFNAFFGVLYALSILMILYLMFAPITIGSENTIISLIVSLLLIILPASFSDEIIAGLRKTLNPIFISIPLTLEIGGSSNNTTGVNPMDLSSLLSGNLPNLNTPFPYFDIINSIVSKFGLWLVIAVIVIALFSLRIIKTVLQLLLVVIVLWAILKYFGLF